MDWVKGCTKLLVSDGMDSSHRKAKKRQESVSSDLSLMQGFVQYKILPVTRFVGELIYEMCFMT